MTGPISLFSTNPSDSLQKPLIPPPSSPQKKLSLFESMSEEPADTALRAARRRGAELPADSASRILRLQTQTGLPREVIANRLDEVEKAAAADSFDAQAFRHANPIVAQWLSENPDNASLAQDDLGQLGKIEGYFTSLGRGAKRGATMNAAATIAQHQREQGGRLLPADEIRLTTLERELAREPQGRDFVADVLFYGGEFAGQMAAMTPEIAAYGTAGVATGAVIGALAGPLGPVTIPVASTIGGTVGAAYGTARSTFRLEGGLAYRELGKVRGPNGEELPENVKRYASIAIGTVNAGLEVFSLSVIAAPFVQMGQRLLRRAGRDMLTKATMRGALAKTGMYYAKAMGSEVGTEILQELNSAVIEDLAKMTTDANFETIFNSPSGREQLVMRMAAVAEQTAKGMLLVGLPGASVTLASNVAQARQAQRRVDYFTALGEDVANSKSFQRLPEATQEIIRRKTENTPIESVYFDLVPLTEYFESKQLDARQLIQELLGSTLEYDQAKSNGTSIRIPMHVYATKLAPTEHNAFLVNEIRMGSQDALNAREAAEAIKEAEELAKIEPEEMNIELDRENLVNELTDKLVQTGRHSAETANFQAQQMADFFLTVEKRTGINPRTLYDLSIGDPETLESLIPSETAPVAESFAGPEADALQQVFARLQNEIVSPEELAALVARFQPMMARLSVLKTEAGGLPNMDASLHELVRASESLRMAARAAGLSETLNQGVTPNEASPSPTTRTGRKGNRFSAELSASLKNWQRRNDVRPKTLPDPLDDVAQRMEDPMAAIVHASTLDEQVDALRADIEGTDLVPKRIGWLPGQLPNANALEELAEFVHFLERNATRPELARLHERVRDIQQAVLSQQWGEASERWAAIPPNMQRWIREGSRAASVWRWIEQGDAMTFYQRERLNNPRVFPLGFFSKAEVLVEKEMGGKASRHQVTKIFEKIKAEEREWLGIEKLLESQEHFTKEEVLKYLLANRLNIKEVLNDADDGVDHHALQEAQNAAFEDEYDGELTRIKGLVTWNAITNEAGERSYRVMPLMEHGFVAEEETDAAFFYEQTFPTRTAVDAYLHEYMQDEIIQDMLVDRAAERVNTYDYMTGSSTYEEYTIPGGRNYRERLFILPDLKPEFDESHFEEENVFAHARMKDRLVWLDSDAENPIYLNTLQIEEEQSDLHQKARSRGYTDLATYEAYQRVQREYDLVNTNYADARRTLAVKLAGWDFTGDERSHSYWLNDLVQRTLVAGGSMEKALADSAEQFRRINETAIAETSPEFAESLRNDPIQSQDEVLNGIPSELMAEIRDFVSLGLQLAEVRADENALRKKVSIPDAPFKKTWHEFVFKALLTEAVHTGKDAIAWTTGDTQVLRYPARFPVVRRAGIQATETPGVFVLYINDKKIPLYQGDPEVTEASLRKRLNPEIAEKLLAGIKEVQTDPDAFPAFTVDVGVTDPNALVYLDRYSMVGFYDKIMVDYANKLGKKYGSQVEVGRLNEVTPRKENAVLDSMAELKLDEAHPRVHVMKITEGMKQAIRQQGFELYQRANHGTPHPARIKKFSTQKILSGEGTLNQGWGLYFTSLKKAARWYRDNLSDGRMSFIYKGKEAFSTTTGQHSDEEANFLDGRSDEEVALLAWSAAIRNFVDAQFDLDEAPDKILEDDIFNEEIYDLDFSVLLGFIKRHKLVFTDEEAQVYLYEWESEGYISKETLQRVEKLLSTIELDKLDTSKTEGRTYEVEIPDDDELMHWDKPLDEQPPHVLEALSRSPALENLLHGPDTAENPVYRLQGKKYSEWMGGGQKAVASRMLLDFLAQQRHVTGATLKQAFLKALKEAESHLDGDYFDREFDRKVKESLKNIKFEDLQLEGPSYTGEMIYGILSNYFNEHAPLHEFSAKELEAAEFGVEEQSGGWRMAAQHLAKLGIKGHTYKSGHGNKNFVIWDDKAIEIVDEFLQAEKKKNQDTLFNNYDREVDERMETEIREHIDYGNDRRSFDTRTPPEENDKLLVALSTLPGINPSNIKSHPGQGPSADPGITISETLELQEIGLGNYRIVEALPSGAFRKSRLLTGAPEVMKEVKKLLNKHPDKFMQEEGEPLAKITFQGDKVNIQLFERANFSSFLHESGHLYLETLTRLVTDKGVTGQVAEDLKIFQTAIGALPGATVYTVEQHETFARLAEAYFREGRAPSSKLREAFYNFRVWLKALYSTVDDLGVELTDDVRQAFDRIFATDNEIAAKESDAAITPLFTDAAAAGMTEEQFKVYKKAIEKGHRDAVEKLQAKMARDEQKRRNAEYREAKQTITAEVTAEINNMPIFRTLLALQKGEKPDGTPLDAPLKIDRQAIVDAKGEDFLVQLPLPYVYAREGGVSLQDAADLLGYDSGDALLEALVDAPNRRAVIASEVEQRLKAQFGDVKTDGELDQSAKDAVLNEHRDVIIMAELRALKAKQRSVTKAVAQREREVTKEATKERAYERRWMEAEKKLAVAMAEGKAQAEIEELQDALANLEMEKDKALKDAEKERAYERRFLEAEAAKEQNEGLELLREGNDATLPTLKDIRQMAKARIAQLTLREIHPHRYWVAARRASQAAVKAAIKDDYVTALNAKQAELLSVAMHREAVKAHEQSQKLQRYAKSLLKPSTQERIGLAGATYLDQVNQLLERFDFRQVSAKEARGRKSLVDFVTQQQALGLPVNIPDDLLNEAFRLPWKDMTLEDLQNVTDTLKHIVHLANTKNRLLAAGAKRSFDNAVAAATGAIRNNAKSIRPRVLETRLPDGIGKRLYEGYFVMHRKFSNLIRQMDGFKDNGILWETFVLPLNQAMDVKTKMTADMTKGLHELFEKHYPGRALAGMYTKKVAPSLDGTSLTKMGRLMMALNWGTEDNRAKLVNGLGQTLGREVDESEVMDVLDELTEEDWTFVEDVWQFLDQFWKPMEELSQRLDGVAPDKIPASPFTNRFGKAIAGGYFPIKYDDRQSKQAFKNVVAQRASKIMSASATRASTKAGSRHARVENVKMPLRLDFGVMFEHLEEVALDLSHTETLIDVTRLLNAPDIESAVRDHYGDQVYKMMLGTIRDIAAGDIPPQNTFDQGLNWIRHGSSIAALAWNVSTSLLQPFGLTQSVVRLGGGVEGVKWVGRGIKRWLTDAANMENTVAWIQQVSPFMANRSSTFLREINEIQNRVGVASNKMHVYLSFGIEQATLDKLDLQDVQDSFFWMISRAQLIADIPTWLGAYEKALAHGIDEERAVLLADQAVIDSQATGQMKDMAEIQRGNPALKLWTNFYTFFSAAWNLNVDAVHRTDFKSPASIGRLAGDMLLLNIIPVILGKMLKDALKGEDEEDDWAKAMAAEVAAYMANMLIGFREFSGILQGFYNYGGTSGARVFNEAGKLIKQVSQGEIDKALLKAANTTGGILFHYPASQIQRSTEGWIAFMDGKAGILALIFGPPRT